MMITVLCTLKHKERLEGVGKLGRKKGSEKRERDGVSQGRSEAVRKARKEAWEGASSVCPGTKAVYKQRSCTVGNVCPSHSQHVAYHINTLASILSNYTNPTLDQSISSWDKHCSHFKSDRHTHTHTCIRQAHRTVLTSQLQKEP